MLNFKTDLKLLITIILILVCTFVLGAIVDKILKRFMYKGLEHKDFDVTGFKFLKHLIITVIYILGISFALIQIPEFKIIGHSLLAGAGVISLIAGLASQQALSNIMSGIFFGF